jgi:hypothetical protein
LETILSWIVMESGLFYAQITGFTSDLSDFRWRYVSLSTVVSDRWRKGRNEGRRERLEWWRCGEERVIETRLLSNGPFVHPFSKIEQRQKKQYRCVLHETESRQ